MVKGLRVKSYSNTAYFHCGLISDSSAQITWGSHHSWSNPALCWHSCSHNYGDRQEMLFIIPPEKQGLHWSTDWKQGIFSHPQTCSKHRQQYSYYWPLIHEDISTVELLNKSERFRRSSWEHTQQFWPFSLILTILSGPVLRMVFQNCTRHKQEHINIVSFSKALA